jgi:hypothetical protein
MEEKMKKLALFFMAAALAFFVGCEGRSSQTPDGGKDGLDGWADGDGGGGDSNIRVFTIYDIQDVSSAHHPVLNSQVRIENVIVTTPVYPKSTPKGFWVEEKTGGKFSGIYIYAPSLGVSVKPGDVVNVEGKYVEYYDQTQIEASSVTTTGTDSVPAPVLVTPSQVRTGGTDAEAYEGVLVEVQNVVVSRASVPGSDGKDHGDFGVTTIGGSEELIVTYTFANDYYTYQRTAGDKFNKLTGVLQYSFGEFRLAPRGCDDLIRDSGQPVCQQQVCPDASEAVAIARLQNPQHPQAVAAGCTVKVEGAVVTSPVFVTGTNQQNFYIEDPSGGQWSGIFVRVGQGTVDVAPGDVVTLSGKVEEYYGKTRLVVTSVTKTGTASVPEPVLVTPAQVNDQGSLSESLEGVLIKLENVQVTDKVFPGTDGKDHGDFLVAAQSELDKKLVIGWDFKHGYACPEGQTVCNPAEDKRKVGDIFNSITGLLDYSFEHFRLQPRTDADLVLRPANPDDLDNDGVPNASDNCPQAYNPDQSDNDADGMGNACDNCLNDANADQADGDDDGVGNVCDNCPGAANADQKDLDHDGIGDVCDSDVDGDAILDDGDISGTPGDNPCTGGATANCDDNCPAVPNPGQEDSNSNGIGDACESTRARLILSEIFYNSTGSDDGNEWIEIYNNSDQAIDLSGYSIGYGGTTYTTGTVQLQGTIPAGGCFVVGGPNVSATSWNPSYDQIVNFNPDLQNSGENEAADGIALFDVPAAQITASRVPIDAVLYGGPNSSNLIDQTGKPGTSAGYAFANQSMERTSTGWRVQTTPSPNNCAHVNE